MKNLVGLLRNSDIMKLEMEVVFMYTAIISDQIQSDLEASFKVMKELGYKHVELHNVFGKSIEACSEDEVKEIKDLVIKYELKVVNLASTVFFLCPLYPEYKVSLFNSEFYTIEGDIDTHLQYLENACKIANELDCKNVRVFPFRFPDNEEIVVVGGDKDIENISIHLSKAVKIAEEYGITLVLENCPYSHLPKGEMTLEVIKRVNHPNLKLLWDPANSYRAEKHKVPKQYMRLDLMSEYKLIKDYIGHVHLKNYTYDSSFEKPFLHKSLLDGDIDYPKLLKEMNHQYQGCFSLEPEVNYEDTIISMKELTRITNR